MFTLSRCIHADQVFFQNVKKECWGQLSSRELREKHDAVFQKKKTLLKLVYNLGLTLKGLYKDIVI